MSNQFQEVRLRAQQARTRAQETRASEEARRRVQARLQSDSITKPDLKKDQ